MNKEIKKELDRRFCESFLRGVYNFASGASKPETTSSDSNSGVGENDTSSAEKVEAPTRESGTTGKTTTPSSEATPANTATVNRAVADSLSGLTGKDGRIEYSFPNPASNITTYNNSPVPAKNIPVISQEILTSNGSATTNTQGLNIKNNPGQGNGKIEFGLDESQLNTDEKSRQQLKDLGVSTTPVAVNSTPAQTPQMPTGEELDKGLAEYEEVYKNAKTDEERQAINRKYARFLSAKEARNTALNLATRMVPGKNETWSQAWERLTPEQKWGVGIGGGVSSLLALQMLTKKKKDLSDYLMAGVFPIAGVAAGAFGGSALTANPNTFDENVYRAAYQRFTQPQPETGKTA